MLNYEFPPIGGGAGQAHLNILGQFANHPELQVDVLTSAVGKGIEVEDFSSNIKIHRIGIRKKNLHYWLKSEVITWLFHAGRYHRKLINENNYDLAHAFFGFPTGYLSYKTADKLPYIISLRGSDVPGYNVRLGIDYTLLAGLFRRIWHKAEAVVANSQGLAELAKRFTPDIDIPVITNGIDTQKFRPTPTHKLGNKIKILTVCRLIKRKRIDILIRAVKICLDRGFDIKFSIAGHGNLRYELENLATSLGISQNVRFLGRVEASEMPVVYRFNDLFVMSSAHEGMSNAMLEAMATGLPIITTHCEGVDELISDNGIISPDDTPESFAESIINAITGEIHYKDLRNAARAKSQIFSWANTATQYIKIYNNIIN